MTFSLLAQDKTNNTIGGVAATGNLCVGGWVLRATAAVGISASQGAFPSTLSGEAVLAGVADGESAGAAVQRLTAADSGSRYRQLAALDNNGSGGIFSGAANGGIIGEYQKPGLVAAGNLLANDKVLPALVQAYRQAEGGLAQKLLAAIEAAAAAGGDKRGLLSAALLIVSPAMPPLSLRIDYNEQPIAQLRHLYQQTQQPEYAGWLQSLPTVNDPQCSGS